MLFTGTKSTGSKYWYGYTTQPVHKIQWTNIFISTRPIGTNSIWGRDQRRYRIGDMAYDRQNGFLYVLELFADGAKPVVHVWKVQ